jgi:acetylornithine/N-succinyldiaminopimelate aminotransferase
LDFSGLKSLVAKHSTVLESYRGWGLILGLVIKEDCNILASEVVAEAAKRGLLLVPAGLKASTQTLQSYLDFEMT